MKYIKVLKLSWRNMVNNKLLGLLGMAAKAGKLTYGGNLVRTKIQSLKKPNLVLLSSDSSQNTKKRITNCCTYYGCCINVVDLSSEEIGHITGRAGSISCVAINDEGFATAMEKAIDETSTDASKNS